MSTRFANPVVAIPLLLAAGSLALSAALSLVAPLPQPQFHDEFSYLLAADTFAHGRLTNPAHPLWPFFETFQVLQQPTYMSKYQPGQGLFLAAGQIITGQPIAGVWLSTALAVAASWWALAAVMPRRWAVFGAALIATHPMVLSWNGSYWGGSVAMIGGCMVFGAALRLGRPGGERAGVSAAVLTALSAVLVVGFIILFNTRPLEGVVFTGLCLLLRWGTIPRLLHRPAALLAALALLVAAAAWTGYYNWRITGHATQFPYTLYEKQYAPTAPLVWLPPPRQIPHYRHEVMRRFYLGWELANYQKQRTVSGAAQALLDKSWAFLKAYLASPALVLAAAGLPLALRRDPFIRRGVLAAIPFLALVFSALSFFPHYIAPAAILLFAILLRCLRRLRAALPRALRSRPLLFCAHFIGAILWIAALVERSDNGWNFDRARLIASLRHEGGQHLVIVRPAPGQYVHNEWVYNVADIDASPVVWARDMGREANRALLSYFRARRTWLLDFSRPDDPFRPYPAD